MVLFDQGTYDKLLVEVPKYKLITPSVLSDRLRVSISSFSTLSLSSLFRLALQEILVKCAEFHELIRVSLSLPQEVATFVSGTRDLHMCIRVCICISSGRISCVVGRSNHLFIYNLNKKLTYVHMDMQITGSLARRAIKELMAKGTIRLVAAHANQQIYTRATNTQAVLERMFL